MREGGREGGECRRQEPSEADATESIHADEIVNILVNYPTIKSRNTYPKNCRERRLTMPDL